MKYSIVLFFIMSLSYVYGNNVQVNNVNFDPGPGTITFDLSWDNSWRDATGDFQDAVWVFVKYRPVNGEWIHADIQQSGTLPTGMDVIEPADLKGAFVIRSAGNTGSGNIPSGAYTFDVINSVPTGSSFQVFAIEMVYVPTGSFYAGGFTDDPINDTYLVAPQGMTAVPLLISSENLIPQSSYAVANSTAYSSDIPAAFPKGYNGFYCMKYKISQSQYVAFLNTLNTTQQQSRIESNLLSSGIYAMSNTGTPQSRNGVFNKGISPDGFNYEFGCDLNNNGTINEADDGMDLVCNFLNEEDVRAYLDWAALRPMSRLEAWKLCRGSANAVTNEYAWGSNTINFFTSADLVNSGASNERLNTVLSGPSTLGQMATRCGFTATASSNRTESGGSFYGIMDINNGIFEVSASFADFLNTFFNANLGDGTLDTNGDSDDFLVTLNEIYGGIYTINIIEINISPSTRINYISGRGVR